MTILFISSFRTSFHLKIDLDKFVLINMNGTVVRLNWVLDDLEDYVKMQVYARYFMSLTQLPATVA